jgi:hypothetical protein
MISEIWILFQIIGVVFIIKWIMECLSRNDQFQSVQMNDKTLTMINGSTTLKWRYGEEEPSITGPSMKIDIQKSDNRVKIKMGGSQSVDPWKYKD